MAIDMDSLLFENEAKELTTRVYELANSFYNFNLDAAMFYECALQCIINAPINVDDILQIFLECLKLNKQNLILPIGNIFDEIAVLKLQGFSNKQIAQKLL